MTSIRLGSLDATEFGLLACILLLLGAVAWTWTRLHREHRRIGELEKRHVRFEKGLLELDPELLERQDENLVELLHSLWSYSRSIRHDDADLEQRAAAEEVT